MDDFRNLNLNNNYTIYDNKGFSSLNNKSNEKTALNQQQHIFNNNFHSSLNPNDLNRNGYSSQNSVVASSTAKNRGGNVAESNVTATFNKKFSAEKAIVEDTVDLDDNIEDKSQVIINFKINFFI